MEVKLNPGSQAKFVLDDTKWKAYIGGLGSGKTFAGINLILRHMFTAREKTNTGRAGPRTFIGSRYFPELKRVILPQLFEITADTGIIKPDGFRRGDMIVELSDRVGGGEILFGSLEDPNRHRGIEICGFYIDEGRNVKRNAWDVLVGRLRQKGFRRTGAVGSTPNGYDWMYDLFHPESDERLPGAEWYPASSYDNAHNTGLDYIQGMEAQYEGLFFDQEVLGKFIGVMHGSCFPEWKPPDFNTEVPYDPSLPLYCGWDFGISDLCVCLFVQLQHIDKKLPSGGIAQVPVVRFVDLMEYNDTNVPDWAEMFHEKVRTDFDGRYPDKQWGDPAGKARNQVTGTSVIQALREKGIRIIPARKQPADKGITILKNLMAGGRVLTDAQRCGRLSKAFSSHHWPTDPDSGLRMGREPVHDWTSHFVSAGRYFATQALSLKEFKKPPKPKKKPTPLGSPTAITAEEAFREFLTKPDGFWLGQEN